MKFTELSKYSPSLVATPRDLTIRFMTRVYELVKEQCRMAMLVDDMDISLLMVFSQQIEESKINKERKRSRVKREESNGHGRSKNRQKFSGQGYSSNSRYEKSNNYSRPTCPGYGKKHKGRCLEGRDVCYGCG